MNALVKKEIRLLLPSWIVAVLLAMVQAITRPYDFYVASLLFFGLTMMALTTIGRETSLNTFSSLLAQPTERLRIWQTKISVLAGAFLSVFAVWLAAFGIAFFNSNVDANDRENSYNLFITISLIATATFTGGLWATLLLRQIAGAFWLTLLVPAVLAGFTAAFLAENHSDNALIAVLCVVLGIYSVGGFLFARWLFFRAQDAGWTGGIIALPQWKFFAAGDATGSARKLKPISTLLKKEFQLQQVSLLGAAGLLVMHIGVIVFRSNHTFVRESAGQLLTSIFWMLWLVLPVIIGAMSVAEERRLGVMESQLCLPVSRRVQFVIKGFLALFLGTLLGGVLPMFLEAVTHNMIFKPADHGGESGVLKMLLSIVALSAWLALVSFFASSLARNFLQAIGYAIATFIASVLLGSALINGRMFFVDYVPVHSFLPVIIAILTVIVVLPWLAYLNFKNFRDDWSLWRRNLLGLVGAVAFIVLMSTALYNRAWEIFLPVEPAHGPAKFSLTHPPVLRAETYGGNLLVQLPDGRVWFDSLNDFGSEYQEKPVRAWLHQIISPWPRSTGPQRFINGSNWVCASAQRIDTWVEIVNPADQKSTITNSTAHIPITGYAESFGIQPDGTLWISEKSDQNRWTADKLEKFGAETDWSQAGGFRLNSILLLKKDGTLWYLGTNHVDWKHWPQSWPGLRAFQPRQMGNASDWKEFSSGSLVRKNDGTVWGVSVKPETGEERFQHVTNLDEIPPQKISRGRYDMDHGAFIRDDGTLWIYGDFQPYGQPKNQQRLQSGAETNWVAVAMSWQFMVALKSDGTLWKWEWKTGSQSDYTGLPTRLGIHHDWVSITAGFGDGVVALAADGSLWFWPYRQNYEYATLLKLPKQPQLLGNVFGKAD